MAEPLDCDRNGHCQPFTGRMIACACARAWRQCGWHIGLAALLLIILPIGLAAADQAVPPVPLVPTERAARVLTHVPPPPGALDYLWLFGAIGCQVCMVLAYRAASRAENDRHAVLVGAYLVSSVVSLGLGFAENGATYPLVFALTLFSLPMILGLAGGIFLVFSAELYLRGTAHGPMSITWTIRQTETMPPTVISFFKDPAGEFSIARLIGVLLMLPALIMFGWDKRVQERKAAAAAAVATPGKLPTVVPWMLFTVLSMLLLSAFRTGTLWVVPETKMPFMLYQYVSCLVVALLFVVGKGHGMRWGELKGGMILGVVSSFNLYFTLTAMSTVGPVMTFAALAVGVPTTVTIVGIFLYGERLNWRSAVGLLLAMVALVLTVKINWSAVLQWLLGT